MKYILTAGLVLVMNGYALGQQKREDGPQLPKKPLCQFTAKVKWIEIVGKRKGKAIPIGTQPELNWLVGIDILSIEKAARPFDKKARRYFLFIAPQ